TLVALREMAMRQTAHEIEERLESDSEMLGVSETQPPRRARKRDDAVVIYISDDPSTAMLIRRGKRVADITHANCFAVFVSEHPDLQTLPPLKREAVKRHLNFARNLHIDTRVLVGHDHAPTVVEF